MRGYFLILLILALCDGRFMSARAQASADQLMQIMMSQPHMDISTQVTATVSFDPPIVRPGEKSVYRVTFNATSDASSVSVKWPEPMPAPPPLKLRLTAGGHDAQMAGGAIQMFSTFNFDARSAAAGTFAVPEYTVEVYGKQVTVPAAQLEVNSEVPEPHEPARALLIQPSKTNVFVGEVFNVSVLLPATAAGAVEAVSDVQINGESFLVDKNSARQSIRPVDVNGRNAPAYIYETGVTPVAAGSLELSAQGFTAGMNFGGPISITGHLTIPSGPPKFVLLDSEPVTINVRPLPMENALPGFTGIIGNYTCAQPILDTNTVNLGEPVKLTIVVRGRENLDRISAPPPPRIQGWQTFPAVRGAIVGDAGTTNRGASFTYTMIPLTAGAQATPAIPFSCFDPERGGFVDLTIPPVALNVVAGGLPAESDAAILSAANIPQPEQNSSLSRLATARGKTIRSLVPWQMQGWFVIVQLLPVCALFVLLDWDRRRRFLAAHPEIVRRREALRALRRERRVLRRAAADGDSPGFIRSGVMAVQIAAAPHYPAEPRALVCGEVLNLFNDGERDGRTGEVIRQFFTRAAAASFAPTREDAAPLFELRPELERILQQLEARL
jgi:hypothetical protein